MIVMGRSTKLTVERKELIIASLRQGNSYRVTAALAHIHETTLIGWLKKGKAERGTELAKFYKAAMEARVQIEKACTQVVRGAIMGGWYHEPIRDKEGHFIPEIDPDTGELARDEKGQISFATELKLRRPDAALAMRVLKRTNRTEWGELDSNTGPDPQTELDKAPSEEPGPEFDHHYYEKSTIQRAAEYLTANKVEIPGYILVPLAAADDVAPAKG
jgi:hypothetical protein